MTILPAGLALVLAGFAIYVSSLGPRLAYMFGPPAATLKETYADQQGTARFDHAALDGLLRRYVDDAGFVDYAGLASEKQTLDHYLDALGQADVENLGRDERLALLLNAYNAFTLRLILDHRPLGSIREIPEEHRWDDVRWVLGGKRYSLNQIEHELIRPNFREPRVHFALVCAAVGCPPLRREAYTADRLEAQLEAQAVYVHTSPRWLRYEDDADTAYLTRLYDWYAGDFQQVAGSILAYAARYVPALNARIEAGRPPRVEHLDYEWALNSKENRR
jgi:hypothetical protein